MNRAVFLILWTCFAVSGAYANDAAVVRAVLDSSGLSWPLDSVATFRDGRIVSLDLSNRNVGKDGIRVLLAEIGELTELTKLLMNDNDLTSLPAAIGSLTNLSTLELQNNSLLSLPPEIGGLAALRTLDLRNNELDALPKEIAGLKSLVKLQLWGNRFTSLPGEISGLTALQELYLKGNRLTSLPASITKLKLKYIDVHDNKLCKVTGAVDTWLKKFDKKYISLQRCQDEKRFK